MNREVEKDYKCLIDFFDQYSLKDLRNNHRSVKYIKKMHKKLYSLMVFINEADKIGCVDETSLKYFKEVGADLMLSFSCWANGLYKASQLQMRSSIENYLKAIAFKDNQEIINKKSVYEIFDIAGKASGFKSEFFKERYNILSSEYSSLCAIVHGDISKLSNISGLIRFCKYDEVTAKIVGDEFDKITTVYLSIIYYVYYNNIFMMHELNRELFLHGLTKHDKAEIYRIKSDS